jgi:hypothetical protein
MRSSRGVSYNYRGSVRRPQRALGCIYTADLGQTASVRIVPPGLLCHTQTMGATTPSQKGETS